MGFRFHRSFRVLPGVRLNMSKRGLGLSIGNSWGGFSVGPAGTRVRAALPGTGLSWSKGVGGSKRAAAAAAVAGAVGGRRARRELPPPLPLNFEPSFVADGSLVLLDSTGQPFAAEVQQGLRRTHRAQLEPWVAQSVEVWNEALQESVDVHEDTPPPDAQLVYTPRAWDTPAPPVPTPPRGGCLSLLWPPARKAAAAERQRLLEGYATADQTWNQARTEHQTQEERRRWLYETGRHQEADAMEETIEHVVAGIPWPYETLLSAQVNRDRLTAWIDVDLPEIESVPTFRWKTHRGLDVARNPVSDTQVRKDYALHVHSVLFRVIGETFAALPNLQQVVASGFTTRLNKATGHTQDDYLLSVRVDRARWNAIRFEALEQVDPVEALAVFDLRRKMTATGIFTPVEPFAPNERE
jgi:hypothetical protein